MTFTDVLTANLMSVTRFTEVTCLWLGGNLTAIENIKSELSNRYYLTYYVNQERHRPYTVSGKKYVKHQRVNIQNQ